MTVPESGSAAMFAPRGVPVMAYQGQRGPDELLPFYEKMGPDGVQRYWARKNALSIDGKNTGTV